MACPICNGFGKNPKKRKENCLECSGSGYGKFCADCGKEIIGTGNFENSEFRCVCQDIPDGAI